jgi:hypothetical protein
MGLLYQLPFGQEGDIRKLPGVLALLYPDVRPHMSVGKYGMNMKVTFQHLKSTKIRNLNSFTTSVCACANNVPENINARKIFIFDI